MDLLAGKKIGIIGLGVNNQKLADYLKSRQIDFTVIEHWDSPDELVGKLDDFDVVFRTPGLPYLSKAVTQAKGKGVLIYSQTKLFFDLCPCPIIGVTGTKGKGTTATLLAQILKDAGKTVWLAGNVGSDPFEFLDDMTSKDYVILELSSFQLQDLHKSPHVAVVLNITSDHLDHHSSHEEYLEAKSQILAHQSESDIAVLSKKLPDAFVVKTKARKVFFDGTDAKGFDTRLFGSHNLENIAAAAAVAKVLGIQDEKIKDSISDFRGLPHHLQPISIENGVTFVDDSASTNIDSTVAAIASFTDPVILIVGGHDKGLDYGPLGRKIIEAGHVKGLVVIGELTPKILDAIKGYLGKILTGAKSMSEIISQAKSIAQKNDIVLLSPGAASFDMFKNSKDRGDQFINLLHTV
jgi:UDP-N-acetylmuramoylalanine--D-glutamate ligase